MYPSPQIFDDKNFLMLHSTSQAQIKNLTDNCFELRSTNEKEKATQKKTYLKTITPSIFVGTNYNINFVNEDFKHLSFCS